MKKILIFIMEFIFEVASAVDSQFWGTPKERSNATESDVVASRSFLWLCAGGLLGWYSLLALPTLVLSNPSLRIANVVIAPLISATVSFYLAQMSARANPDILPWRYFWYAFSFTLAFVGLRFASSMVT